MCIHVALSCEMLLKECYLNLQRCTGLHALLVALWFSLKALYVDGLEKAEWTDTSLHVVGCRCFVHCEAFLLPVSTQEVSLAVEETRVAIAKPEENRVVWDMHPGTLPARELSLLSFRGRWVSLMTAEPLRS